MAQGNYRIIVSFDSDKRIFRARAPELEQCSAEGASRAEAVGRLEEEMAAQLANIAQHGGHVPPAVDDVEDGKLGQLQVRLSKSTHRELLWAARQEGVPVDQLAGEILSAAVESRRARGPGRPRPQQGGRPDGQRDDDIGNRVDGRDGRPQRGYGARYHGIMDDSANFLEYVRGLEAGGGGGPRPGGRPPGGGDRGGGGGGGGGRRRRGRGRGPGDRGPGDRGPGGPPHGAGGHSGGGHGGSNGEGGGSPAGE